MNSNREFRQQASEKVVDRVRWQVKDAYYTLLYGIFINKNRASQPFQASFFSDRRPREIKQTRIINRLKELLK